MDGSNITRRDVEEWFGKTPNTALPPRVKARIMAAQGDCCAECRMPFSAQMRPEFDHTVALINGGENRETNMRAICCPCHGTKTAADVAMKAKVARVRAKHLGLHNQKSRPIPGSKASGIKMKVGGGWERR